MYTYTHTMNFDKEINIYGDNLFDTTDVCRVLNVSIDATLTFDLDKKCRFTTTEGYKDVLTEKGVMLLATSLATPAAKRVQKWILVDRDETHKAEIRKEAFCKEYNVSGFVYINGGDQVDDTDKGYKIGRAKNEKCVTTRKNVMKQMSSKTDIRVLHKVFFLNAALGESIVHQLLKSRRPSLSEMFQIDLPDAIALIEAVAVICNTLFSNENFQCGLPMDIIQFSNTLAEKTGLITGVLETHPEVTVPVKSVPVKSVNSSHVSSPVVEMDLDAPTTSPRPTRRVKKIPSKKPTNANLHSFFDKYLEKDEDFELPSDHLTALYIGYFPEEYQLKRPALAFEMMDWCGIAKKIRGGEKCYKGIRIRSGVSLVVDGENILT